MAYTHWTTQRWYEFLMVLRYCRLLSKPLQTKAKWSNPVIDPVVAQRVGRVIALLFHDRGTRRGWVVSSTSRPHFTPGKDPVPIVKEAGWAPEPVWTGGKSRPTGIRSPDRPACSQSLYRLSYPAHIANERIRLKHNKILLLWAWLEHIHFYFLLSDTSLQ